LKHSVETGLIAIEVDCMYADMPFDMVGSVDWWMMVGMWIPNGKRQTFLMGELNRVYRPNVYEECGTALWMYRTRS